MPSDKTRRSSKRFKIKENKKYPYKNKRTLWQRKNQEKKEKESS